MTLLVVTTLLLTCALTPDSISQRASPAQVSAKTERSKYVGARIGKSLPAGLRSKSHFLILSKSGEDIPADFGIREVSRGKVKMLWLDRAAQRDAKSVLQWEVLDVLTLPAVRKTQVLAHSFCFIGEEYEPEVLAICVYEDKAYFTRVRRAWRANRLKGRFEEIPVKNIRCENEGWGV